MRNIVDYLKKFIVKDFHFNIYLITIVALCVLVFFNYQTDFEDTYIDSFQQSNFGFFVYLLYYSIPFYFVIGLYLFFLPKERAKLSERFFFKSFFALSLLAFKVWFFYHIYLEPNLETALYQERYLFHKFSSPVKNSLIYTTFILLFYKFFEIENKNLYGLRSREFHYKPFFILIAIMVPFIFFASFQTDFLEAYPRLQLKYVQQNYFSWFAAYEPVYLFEFITLEWFFRGFLVIGFVQLIGKRAVLPMAVLYCVFHFGKPLGECIGSFFGGYILGVIAYQSRSIWGGIIIHLGVAFLMDLFALIQHLKT